MTFPGTYVMSELARDTPEQAWEAGKEFCKTPPPWAEWRCPRVRDVRELPDGRYAPVIYFGTND